MQKLTGPHSGLGVLICDKFAKEGANVVVNYNSSQAAGEELAATLRKEYGVKAVAIKGVCICSVAENWGVV